MRVDFYQLSRDPAEQLVAHLARNTLAAGQRLLVVHGAPARLEAISEALWAAPPHKGAPSFLAHGRAGSDHDARQPILLSHELEPANGARFLALADGQWRESEGFDRVFLVFDGSTIEDARACWRMLGSREGVARNYWKQEGSGWVQAA